MAQEQKEELQIPAYDDYSQHVLKAKRLLVDDDLAYLLGNQKFQELYLRLKEASRELGKAAKIIYYKQFFSTAAHPTKEAKDANENNPIKD